MTRSTPVLSVSGLQKHYGNFKVVNNLNLQVEQHAIHGLVGLNGSGKTTTLECILGMHRYDGGDISVLGHQPIALHQANDKVVAIFDTPSLHPNLSVRQCLEHARLLCDKPMRSANDVESLLGISKYSKFKIKQLSLGNKRRASIAQALLGNPELIILDEPFNGLDAAGVDDVLALIKHLNKEEGTSFLLSSHQLPYLEQVCTHIAILHEGVIAISDAVDKLFVQERTTVLLRVAANEQLEKALSIAKALPGVSKVSAVDERSLSIELQHGDSATLNRELVMAGIDVAQLQVQEACLTTLFQQVTQQACEQ